MTLLYAVASCAQHTDAYRRPQLAWALMAVMALWTAGFWLRPRSHKASILIADLVIACSVAALTLVVDTPERIAAGAQTLPTVWAASPVLAWAVWRGARGGLIAALCVSAVDVVVAGRFGGNTLHNNFLLLVLGGIVGYCADLFRSGHLALRRALAVEAATAERERLARDIHDSVLQVLAFVQRRAREIGGDAESLGVLAGEQERRLRTLVSAHSDESAPVDEAASLDLCALLAARADDRTTLVTPGARVALPAASARELAAAVIAALDNVAQHAGPDAHAWVLVEDEGEHVAVTVRDDGVGCTNERLLEAERSGRLGVSLSLRARLASLGGTCDIRSVPGEGTEVRLRAPQGVTVARGGG